MQKLQVVMDLRMSPSARLQLHRIMENPSNLKAQVDDLVKEIVVDSRIAFRRSVERSVLDAVQVGLQKD